MIGRPKGSRNKSTKDIKLLAAPYGPEAIGVLAKLMHEGETHSVRVNAARELLDRGFGRASQPIEHSGQVDVAMTLDRLIERRREQELAMRVPALGVSPGSPVATAAGLLSGERPN